MEQVEGGDLVVNKGKESRPKESSDDSRDLNAVETYEAAYKLAQVPLPLCSMDSADCPARLTCKS
jgi:hypothetical protein